MVAALHPVRLRRAAASSLMRMVSTVGPLRVGASAIRPCARRRSACPAGSAASSPSTGWSAATAPAPPRRIGARSSPRRLRSVALSLHELSPSTGSGIIASRGMTGAQGSRSKYSTSRARGVAVKMRCCRCGYPRHLAQVRHLRRGTVSANSDGSPRWSDDRVTTEASPAFRPHRSAVERLPVRPRDIKATEGLRDRGEKRQRGGKDQSRIPAHRLVHASEPWIRLHSHRLSRKPARRPGRVIPA